MLPILGAMRRGLGASGVLAKAGVAFSSTMVTTSPEVTPTVKAAATGKAPMYKEFQIYRLAQEVGMERRKRACKGMASLGERVATPGPTYPRAPPPQVEP